MYNVTAKISEVKKTWVRTNSNYIYTNVRDIIICKTKTNIIITIISVGIGGQHSWVGTEQAKSYTWRQKCAAI